MEHDMKLEKITFCPDGDEAVEFFVLDSQRLAGVNYLLVTDSEVGDGEALILKDVSADADLSHCLRIHWRILNLNNKEAKL